ncbi:MAG: hypothetical protein LCI00_28255 [Chloroflexi bacterium]|nr:hypothetical protein [Chloroflexota bacterium]
MPEPAAAAKKPDPHKQPVRAPAPDPQLATPLQTPEGQVNPHLTQREILQLQRTMGNKAVGSLLGSQPKAAPPAPVELRASGEPVIQEWPWSTKPDKPAKPKPPPYPRPAKVSAPTDVKPMDPTHFNSDIVATDAQMQDPVTGLKNYREAAGKHLEEGKRHKFKILRYKTFIEADYLFIKQKAATLVQQQETLIAEEAMAQKSGMGAGLGKKRAELEQQSKAEIGEGNPMLAVSRAEERVGKALNASLVAESELPLIAHAYDTIVTLQEEANKKGGHGFFGGHPEARIKHYEALLPNAGPKDAAKYRTKIHKHHLRVTAIKQARQDLARSQTLLGQAKLSEDMMAVKRRQLKAEKAAIKGGAGRAVTIGTHLKGKVTTGIGSAVASTATLGLIEYEQNKTDGGYNSKRERVSIIKSWERDWAQLKGVWAARPYGKLTALHLVFQGLGSLILKPLRKMFTAAALIFTGLSLIPPLAPITGPMAAFCSLVTIGLVAAKAAIDALLATWSALATALNKNAHHTDMLRGQTRGQATDVLMGGVAIGAAFATPAIGNAVGGKYYNPVESLAQTGGSTMGMSNATGSIGDQLLHQLQVQGSKAPAMLGMIVGEKVVGAAGELEAMGDGGKALFQMRQGEIMKSGLSGAQLMIAIEQAKLDAMEGEETRLKRRITFLEADRSGEAEIPKLRDKLTKNQTEQGSVRGKILKLKGGIKESAPAPTASAPTTLNNIKTPGTTALPAQGQFADRMKPELAKEATMRDESTKALGAKAKAQVQGLISSVSEVSGRSGEVASGAQAAVGGVAAAGSAQVQPVDAPNAADAQGGVQSGSDILRDVLEIAQAAPSAVDEAINPAPVSGGGAGGGS